MTALCSILSLLRRTPGDVTRRPLVIFSLAPLCTRTLIDIPVAGRSLVVRAARHQRIAYESYPHAGHAIGRGAALWNVMAVVRAHETATRTYHIGTLHNTRRRGCSTGLAWYLSVCMYESRLIIFGLVDRVARIAGPRFSGTSSAPRCDTSNAVTYCRHWRSTTPLGDFGVTPTRLTGHRTSMRLLPRLVGKLESERCGVGGLG